MSRTSTGSSSPPSRPPTGVPAAPHTAEGVRRALGALSVRPSRRFGQSFLIDPFVADAEAALVGTVPGQRVLEVGAGLGILTEALLRRGVTELTVVENDPRLVQSLRRTFGDRIQILEGDARVLPLPESDVVVGNLPYSVATPLLLRFFAARVPRVVFMIQDEVARRLAAGPGSKDYGRLSIVTRLYGEVELFRPVAAESFEPAPSVTSRLGVHVARAGALPVSSIPRFEAVVKALFSSRRKQLGNLLPRVLNGSESPEEVAGAAGWPADWRRRRPETLPPEAYFALTNVLDPSFRSGAGSSRSSVSRTPGFG